MARIIGPIAASVDVASTPVATLLVIADAIDWPECGIRFSSGCSSNTRTTSGSRSTSAARLYGHGDREGALQYLTAAVAIRPQSAFARSYLAHALLASGRVEEAIAAYREADRLYAGRPRNRVVIGSACCELPGRDQEAAAEFREAPRLASDPAAVHYDDRFGLRRGVED